MISIKQVPGCYYIENYLSSEEIDKITNDIKSNYFQFENITTNTNSRKVVHFGYEYNYKSTNLIKTEKIPIYYLNLINKNRLSEHNINFEKDFDQLIINEYLPNQGISAHIDSSSFKDGILCITIILSENNQFDPIPIKFQKDNESFELFPNNGSLYIMSGECRWKWKHSLMNKSQNTRYSFTFRRTVN